MLKKEKDMLIEQRENMRGGKGVISFQHMFRQDEIQAKCRLCAKITVPVGASIGVHQHLEEDEIFIILKGKGICDTGKTRKEFVAGDAILTVTGGSHSIENTGDEDVEFIALVMPY
ncbi:MAG: cupin [Candidatus Margulisbacteria bacterium GWF2_35_9]|nr:MAG: cupin [Candidatus Margulisbacteria bacterium GWF2_35_9]